MPNNINFQNIPESEKLLDAIGYTLENNSLEKKEIIKTWLQNFSKSAEDPKLKKESQLLAKHIGGILRDAAKVHGKKVDKTVAQFLTDFYHNLCEKCGIKTERTKAKVILMDETKLSILARGEVRDTLTDRMIMRLNKPLEKTKQTPRSGSHGAKSGINNSHSR